MACGCCHVEIWPAVTTTMETLMHDSLFLPILPNTSKGECRPWTAVHACAWHCTEQVLSLLRFIKWLTCAKSFEQLVPVHTGPEILDKAHARMPTHREPHCACTCATGQGEQLS